MSGARPKIGLALGSGGARGWAHLGVINALQRMGIVPDVVAGASIGALVGAVYAAGVFEAFQKTVEAFSLLQMTRFFAEVRLPQYGLFSGRPIVQWLEQAHLLGARTFAELPIPFAAVATDLHAEQAVVLQEGAVAQAVRASIAIPGIFDPVLHEGRVLVDGGLTDPVPVKVVRALGADVVIAVDVSGAAPTVAPTADCGLPSLAATLMQTTRMVESRICRLTLASDPADVLICPAVGALQTLDFYGGRSLMAEGERAVEACAADLTKALYL